MIKFSLKRLYFPRQNSQELLEEEKVLNDKGQSLVEFVLLLSVIMLISLLFLRLVNTNVAKYWKAMGTVLLEDPSQSVELR